MIPALRRQFNRAFEPQLYRRMLASLDAQCRTHVDFRVAETPCFFPASLLQQMAQIGAELTHQLVDDPVYMAASSEAVPEAYRVPGESAHPNFMTADFGLVRTADGALAPRLVELQAFPSVYAYQEVLSEAYRETFPLDPTLRYFLGGHDAESFWRLYGGIILGGHAAENVVLAEVDPMGQKTLPDFNLTAERLGIAIVDIAHLVPRAGRLYYSRDGRLVPIHRIYNRAIVDELIRKEIHLPFDYREPFDVEWAGHPNWYFRISKFSIPHLRHPSVPASAFLGDWLEGKATIRLPQNRADILLKPLFSFAGKGIQFAPTEDDLAAIPVARRSDYLLQERLSFTPVIDTPFGATQAEVRILYLWPDGGLLEPVLSLVRLGRGKMMGVDHNRDQEWVGASAAFFPESGA